MEIGILGLPWSGKSTLFEIMTGIKSREIFGEPFVRGVAKVPDAKARGKLRLEGKEYVVQDGDIISFRFNV